MSKPTLTKDALTELEISVLNHLKIGHDNTISLKELSQRIGVNERKLRMTIEALRNEGYLVVFFPSKPEGYGIAETQEEARVFIEYMRSRIISECKILRSVKQASFKRFTKTVGQLKMFA